MKKHVTVDHTTKGDIQILRVTGFMDMVEVALFEQRLDKLILQDKLHVILDFTDLEYLSSSGLGAIIGRISEIRRKNGDVKVGGCSSRVLDILKVFGFADVFDVCEDVTAALKKFEK
jgi:anti-sigma B factor antagonist